MSIQEIEQAIAQLPQTQRARLLARLTQSATDAGADGASPAPLPDEELAARRRALADAARVHWTGGDGLEYQLRIRSEWDDRPNLAD